MNTQTAHAANELLFMSERRGARDLRVIRMLASSCACHIRGALPQGKRDLWGRWALRSNGVLVRMGVFLRAWGASPFEVLARCAPLLADMHSAVAGKPSEVCAALRERLASALRSLDAGHVARPEADLADIQGALRSCVQAAGAGIYASGALELLATFARAWTMDSVTQFRIGGEAVACSGNCLHGMPAVVVGKGLLQQLAAGAIDVVVTALAAHWEPAITGSRKRHVAKVFLYPYYNSIVHYEYMQSFFVSRDFPAYLFMVPIADAAITWSVDCAWGREEGGSFTVPGIAGSRESSVFRQTGFMYAPAIKVACALPRLLPRAGAEFVDLRIRFFIPRNVSHTGRRFQQPAIPDAELPLRIRTAAPAPGRAPAQRAPANGRVHITLCTQPFHALEDVEGLYPGMLSLWMRHHMRLNVSRFVVYDVDGSFGDVLPHFLTGPYRGRVTYFPRFAEAVSPGVLGPLSRSTTPIALFYMQLNHCRAISQRPQPEAGGGADAWILHLNFDMWLENVARPGVGLDDAVARFAPPAGPRQSRPVGLRFQDVQIGMHTAARRQRGQHRECNSAWEVGSRGCIEELDREQQPADPTALFAAHKYLCERPLSNYTMSRLDADLWTEDHEVYPRIGDTQVDVPFNEWRILHYDDMFGHRCDCCSVEYTGMARHMNPPAGVGRR